MVAQYPSTPGVVFPVYGYQGTIDPHWSVAGNQGGTDIFAAPGTPVLAMRPSRVVDAGFNPVSGYYVVMEDDDGTEYFYAHMAEDPHVRLGQRVDAGTRVGSVGSTGNANRGNPAKDAHLHIGIGEPGGRVINAGPQGGTYPNYNAVGALVAAQQGAPPAAIAEPPPADVPSAFQAPIPPPPMPPAGTGDPDPFAPSLTPYARGGRVLPRYADGGTPAQRQQTSAWLMQQAGRIGKERNLTPQDAYQLGRLLSYVGEMESFLNPGAVAHGGAAEGLWHFTGTGAHTAYLRQMFGQNANRRDPAQQLAVMEKYGYLDKAWQAYQAARAGGSEEDGFAAFHQQFTQPAAHEIATSRRSGRSAEARGLVDQALSGGGAGAGAMPTQPATPTAAAPARSAYAFPVAGYNKPVNVHWGGVRGASDIFAAPGTPVLAMRGGTVTSVGSGGLGGNNITIQGDDGNEYYYAHLIAPPTVKQGTTVTTGTQIGGVGSTGNADKGNPAGDAHLHIGIGPKILRGTAQEGGLAASGSGGAYDAIALLESARTGTAPPGGGPAVVNQPAVPAAPAAPAAPSYYQTQLAQEQKNYGYWQDRVKQLRAKPQLSAADQEELLAIEGAPELPGSGNLPATLERMAFFQGLVTEDIKNKPKVTDTAMTPYERAQIGIASAGQLGTNAQHAESNAIARAGQAQQGAQWNADFVQKGEQWASDFNENVRRFTIETGLKLDEASFNYLKELTKDSQFRSEFLLKMAAENNANVYRAIDQKLKAGEIGLQAAQNKIDTHQKQQTLEIQRLGVVTTLTKTFDDANFRNAQMTLPPEQNFVPMFGPTDPLSQGLQRLGYGPLAIKVSKIDPASIDPLRAFAKAMAAVPALAQPDASGYDKAVADFQAIPGFTPQQVTGAQFGIPEGSVSLAPIDYAAAVKAGQTGLPAGTPAPALATATAAPLAPAPAAPVALTPEAAAVQQYLEGLLAGEPATAPPAAAPAPEAAPAAATPSAPAPAVFNPALGSDYTALGPGQIGAGASPPPTPSTASAVAQTADRTPATASAANPTGARIEGNDVLLVDGRRLVGAAQRFSMTGELPPEAGVTPAVPTPTRPAPMDTTLLTGATPSGRAPAGTFPQPSGVDYTALGPGQLGAGATAVSSPTPRAPSATGARIEGENVRLPDGTLLIGAAKQFSTSGQLPMATAGVR